MKNACNLGTMKSLLNNAQIDKNEEPSDINDNNNIFK